MHIHILGIGGTFMAGVAHLAVESGHQVSGSDVNVYPPMSTQLDQLGIQISAPDDLQQLQSGIDMYVIGNAMTRGMPVVEEILKRRLNYCSGPAWLAEQVLKQRRVIAVAGTHGKTTTASMITWVLQQNGYEPGYLIGGVPANFQWSAQLGNDDWFVVEADEYDSAFFDKRSKFVHYPAEIAVLNNLEFDHADIFNTLDDIKRQFHHFVRIQPQNACIVYNIEDQNLGDVIDMGCWSEQSTFSPHQSTATGHWKISNSNHDQSAFSIQEPDGNRSALQWELFGQHNQSNALACSAACARAGLNTEQITHALQSFQPAKRRLELLAEKQDIKIFSDFAHHPTAIQLTLEALRSRYPGKRLISLLELGSNTMRMGIHQKNLGPALAAADIVYIFAPLKPDWEIDHSTTGGQEYKIFTCTDELLNTLQSILETGDRVVLMSNGSFAGLPQKITGIL